MKTLIVVVLFALATCLFGSSVDTVAFSRSTLIMQGQSQGGPVALEARDVDIRLILPSGKVHVGTVTVIFDRTSRHYLWRYYQKEEGHASSVSFRGAFISGEAAVYVAPDRLVEFHMSGPLAVVEWTTRANSLDGAEEDVLREINRRLGDESKPFVEMGKEVIVPGLGADFWCDPLSPICTTKTKLTVTRTDGQWHLVVERRGTAEVVLDKEYQVISVKRTDH